MVRLAHSSDCVSRSVVTCVYMAGTSNPGAFRSMGITPAADFPAAWKAARKHVGASPSVVVAPTFWSRPRIKFAVEAGGSAGAA